MTFNTIAFSKGYLFIQNPVNPTLSQIKEYTPSKQIVEFQAELMRFGYILDEIAQYELAQLTNISTIATEIIQYLTDTVGDGEFVSLFGNFPNTALEMNDYEFYTHQIFHYLFGTLYSPIDDKGTEEYAKYSPYLRDSYTKITICDSKKLCDICKTICSATQSLTSYDKECLDYFCNHWQELTQSSQDCFPDEIPFKETACILYNYGVVLPKTITDVLRQIVYECGGDITLENPTKFKKYSRANRRRILNQMNTVIDNYVSFDDAMADMKKYALRWIKLGEILHPGEYKQYPSALQAFTILRNTLKYVETFDSKVNTFITQQNIKELLNLLSTRAGEFARRLNFLLNNYPDHKKEIFNSFKEITPKLSIKIIYELLDYFIIRNNPLFTNNRTVVPKGHRHSVPIKPLPPIDETTVIALMSLLNTELQSRFKTKGSLPYKNLVLDPKLTNIALPKNMRSMNSNQARGTRIPLEDTKDTIRFYTRWEDPQGNIDLDMSAIFYNENLERVCHLGWNGTRRQSRGKDIIAVFSGDVRHRKGNCAEYIDLSISKCLNEGIRYVIGFASDYDKNQFNCDCWSGVMFMDSLEAEIGNTWAPDTIEYGFKIKTNTANSCILSIIDLKERCLIIVDEDYEQNVASAFKAQPIFVRYTLPKYFNAYTLIETNAKSRGIKVAQGTETAISMFKDRDSYIEEFEQRLAELPYEITDPDVLTKVQKSILSKIELLKDTEVITYDDIMTDYTRLFEWMF